MKGVVEKEAHRGSIWKVMVNEHFVNGIWEGFRAHKDRGCHAMRDGRWEEFKERYRKEESPQNGLERRREAYEKLARDEVGRLGIAQEILRKSTDFLRRVIALVGGLGGVFLSQSCPLATRSPWGTTFGGYRTVTARFSEHSNGLARNEQKRHYGRVEKFHRHGQPQCFGSGSYA